MRLTTFAVALLAVFHMPGLPVQAQEARLNVGQMLAMQKTMTAAIKPCLPPQSGRKTSSFAVLRLTFNPDSSLARPPQLLSTTSLEWGKTALHSVTRCLNRKGILAYDEKYYSAWRIINLNLRPSEFAE